MALKISIMGDLLQNNRLSFFYVQNMVQMQEKSNFVGCIIKIIEKNYFIYYKPPKYNMVSTKKNTSN